MTDISEIVAALALQAPSKSEPLTKAQASATFARARNLETYPGVDPTGVVECSAAIQAAINAASAEKVQIISNASSYLISAGITLQDHADLSRAIFSYSGTSGPAITVGNAVPANAPSRKTIHVPYVIATAKTVLGWAQLAATCTGVQVLNMTSCVVHFACSRNFMTGIEFKGVGVGGGVTYSKFYLGQLVNNKRNLVVTTDGVSGYANQNQTFGGTFNFDAAEGLGVVGTRHILIENTPSKIDGWTFHEPSLEDSGGVCEYTVDCAGNNNLIDGGRFESVNRPPSVAWRTGSANNEIRGGVNVDAITEALFGTTANKVTRREGRKVLTANRTLDNTDEGKVIVSNTAAAVTYSLPGVAYRSPGTRVTVQNVGAGVVTVNTVLDPLDGGFTATIPQWASKTFVSAQLPVASWLTIA